MKKLLALILILLASAVIGSFVWKGPAPVTEESQTAALAPVLWKIQNQFHLDKVYLAEQVVRRSDMPSDLCKHAWGCEASGRIYILDVRDMPRAMPWDYRFEFQRKILQHEVMHVVMTQLEVPDDFQDLIIERIRPALVQP